MTTKPKATLTGVVAQMPEGCHHGTELLVSEANRSRQEWAMWKRQLAASGGGIGESCGP